MANYTISLYDDYNGLIGSFAPVNSHIECVIGCTTLGAGRLWSRLGFRFGYGSYGSYASGRVFPFFFFIFTLIFTLKTINMWILII
jgi:hypothetical protein